MFTLNCKGKLVTIDEPIVMGIININNDSFFAGSRQNTIDDVLRQADKMVSEGAFIIDIGGQSTRPGSDKIEAEQELERVLPAIEAVRSRFDVLLSIDTYYATVAKESIAAGADIVNDISAGNLDENMIATVAELKVPYICMHLKGSPQTMQQHANYYNVTLEVIDYFIKKVEECRAAGIIDVIIDPGFGFAKTIAQNFELLRNLSELHIVGKPVMAGLSRKGTIYKTLGITAEEALYGTTVLNTIALMQDANILRVHDVKEAVEAITLFKNYRGSNIEKISF